MKTVKKFLIKYTVAAFMVLAISVAYSQENKQVAKIFTSAQCEMCKETIEKAINKLSGIISAVLDVETKIVTVEYNGEETGIEEIRKAITYAGYDADSLAAVKKVYAKLPKCCKKPEDR